MLPSSIGLSFELLDTAEALQITARWGWYERVTIKEEPYRRPPQSWGGLRGGGDGYYPVWKRTPICGVSEPIVLREGMMAEWTPDSEQPDVYVQGRMRKHDGGWSVTLFLVNGQEEPKREKDSAWLFQPELIVEALDYRTQVSQLLTRWQRDAPTIPSSIIAFALKAAAHTAQRNAPTTELIWTGPTTTEITLRQTEQALLQVIQAAQKELLLVSFTVYPIPAVTQALLDAIKRGVTLTICLEAPQSGAGKACPESPKDQLRHHPNPRPRDHQPRQNPHLAPSQTKKQRQRTNRHPPRQMRRRRHLPPLHLQRQPHRLRHEPQHRTRRPHRRRVPARPSQSTIRELDPEKDTATILMNIWRIK